VSDDKLLCDPSKKAELEAANGVEQLDYLASLVNDYHITELRESHVLQLQELAVKGIYPCAGSYRDARFHVTIQGSAHKVPHESQVPSLVRDAVDWINKEKDSRSALERAAYALWRFNWIHPFAGGNGRASRAICYLVLCMDMGAMPPGVPTVPVLIYQRREEYVAALHAADAGERNTGEPDLSAMTNLLQDVVTAQLASAIDKLASRRH
jgi:Fic family protein